MVGVLAQVNRGASEEKEQVDCGGVGVGGEREDGLGRRTGAGDPGLR